MNSYQAQNVVNGTWGEVWINGVYVAEAIGLQAKISLVKSSVNMCGVLAEKQKVTGLQGKGTLKLNKVTSRMAILMSEAIQQGKQVVCTVISSLSDPDALGAERVSINDVTFDELTIADWEAKKNGEESIPFTFSDWNFLDLISAT